MLIAAFLAGIAGSLSPCVLPLLPLVFIAANSQHKFGSLALAVGVASAYTMIGLFVALVGYNARIDEDFFRLISALILIGFGCVLLISRLESKYVAMIAPVSNWFAQRSAEMSGKGLSGQFLLGCIFGAAWGPCIGPTLGLALTLASQGESLGQASLAMILFGLGASLPLLIVGRLSREALNKWRSSFRTIGNNFRLAFGSICIVLGALIVTGADRHVEALAERVYPDWLRALITYY